MKSLIIIIALLGGSTLHAQTPWIAPKETKQFTNPFEGNEDAVLRGAELFDLLCSVCHGATGKGDGVTLEYLNPKPANLTSEKVQKQSHGEFYWKITTGRPPMQSYVNVLSSDEIWQVIAFIKTLQVSND